MGNVLRLLSRSDGGDSCFFSSIPKDADIFVDFESAAPTEAEAELYAEADAVLAESVDVLARLESYEGASKEIREAIARPDEETEAIAWDAVVPLVIRLKSFYDFSKKLAVVVPKILDLLSSGEVDNSK